LQKTFRRTRLRRSGEGGGDLKKGSLRGMSKLKGDKTESWPKATTKDPPFGKDKGGGGKKKIGFSRQERRGRASYGCEVGFDRELD